VDTEIRRQGQTIRFPRARRAGRAGQASVELIIGFIALIMILAGGIQYLAVSNAHRGITTTLRGEAGEQAMDPISLAATPAYLRTWDPGRDDIRHTDDDTAETTLPLTLYAIADRSVRDDADWDRLTPLERVNPMAEMRSSILPTVQLALIRAERSQTVPVDPAVRNLIFDRPTVTVRHTVWMPLMGGLY